MVTTIKLDEETKERLLSLDLAEKGKSFNTIIIELISSYESRTEEHKKAMKKYQEQSEEYDSIIENHKKEVEKAKQENNNWLRQTKEYDRILEQYRQDTKEVEKQRQTWKKLIEWAKEKGFKE